MSTPTPAAEELKALGNAMYQRGKWGAAIDAYTDAILIAPRWLPVILNRALCHRKRRNWDAVKADCLKALDIDRESIKANYMLGLSLIAERKYVDAVRRLQKALENARASGASIQDEIWRELARAKYLQWELDAAERARRFDAVERKLRFMGALDAIDGNESNPPGRGAFGFVTSHDDEVIDLVEDRTNFLRAGSGDRRPGFAASDFEAVRFAADEKATLEEILRRARKPDAQSEDPPDCFCCVLTFEVFRDPVTCPSGNSYERSAVEEHLKKVGLFDPITRQPMTLEDLRPNVGLRNAAHAWLNEHAWAYADIVKPDAPLGGED
jgi:STIP1 family protein 1